MEQKVDFPMEKWKLSCVVAFKLGHWVLNVLQTGNIPLTLLILRHSEMDWNCIPGSPGFPACLLQILSVSISCEKIPDNQLISQPILLLLLLQRTLIHLVDLHVVN